MIYVFGVVSGQNSDFTCSHFHHEKKVLQASQDYLRRKKIVFGLPVSAIVDD